MVCVKNSIAKQELLILLCKNTRTRWVGVGVGDKNKRLIMEMENVTNAWQDPLRYNKTELYRQLFTSLFESH